MSGKCEIAIRSVVIVGLKYRADIISLLGSQIFLLENDVSTFSQSSFAFLVDSCQFMLVTLFKMDNLPSILLSRSMRRTMSLSLLPR